MTTQTVTERLRSEQAAGIVRTPIRYDRLILPFGFLATAATIAAALLVTAWLAAVMNPMVEEDVPGFMADALYFAPVVTFLSAVSLIVGLLTTSFADPPWRLRLFAVGAVIGALLVLPYQFFSEAIEHVSYLTE